MGDRTGYLSDANVKAHCPERFRPNLSQAYGLFGMSNGRRAQVPSSVTFYLKKQSKQTGVPYETLSKLYAESVKRVAPEILIPVPSTLQNFSSVRIRNQVASIAIRPQPLLVSTRIPAVEADIGLAFERDRLRLEGEQLNRRATEFLSELNAEDATPDLFTQVPSDTSDERSEEGVARARDELEAAERIRNRGEPSEEVLRARANTDKILQSLQTQFKTPPSKLRADAPEFIPTDRQGSKLRADAPEFIPQGKKGLTEREIIDIGISLRPAIKKIKKKFYEEQRERGLEALSSGLQPLIAVSARDKRATDREIRRESGKIRAEIEIARAKFEERERMGQASAYS